MSVAVEDCGLKLAFLDGVLEFFRIKKGRDRLPEAVYLSVQNAVGTRILQLLQENNRLQQVFDTMLEEYDVDEKQLEQDLNELLSKLTDEELITIEFVAV